MWSRCTGAKEWKDYSSKGFYLKLSLIAKILENGISDKNDAWKRNTIMYKNVFRTLSYLRKPRNSRNHEQMKYFIGHKIYNIVSIKGFLSSLHRSWPKKQFWFVFWNSKTTHLHRHLKSLEISLEDVMMFLMVVALWGSFSLKRFRNYINQYGIIPVKLTCDFIQLFRHLELFRDLYCLSLIRWRSSLRLFIQMGSPHNLTSVRRIKIVKADYRLPESILSNDQT